MYTSEKCYFQKMEHRHIFGMEWEMSVHLESWSGVEEVWSINPTSWPNTLNFYVFGDINSTVYQTATCIWVAEVLNWICIFDSLTNTILQSVSVLCITVNILLVLMGILNIFNFQINATTIDYHPCALMSKKCMYIFSDSLKPVLQLILLDGAKMYICQ